jgi:hypothetical protein
MPFSLPLLVFKKLREKISKFFLVLVEYDNQNHIGKQHYMAFAAKQYKVILLKTICSS